MKLIKMLGLAMVASVVAMAFFGASSASAFVLCKENKSPCPAGQSYANGTEIKGTSANAKLVGPFGAEVVCSSEVKGKITEGQQEKEQVIGEITSATFTGCNHGCTVTTVQLPWRAHVSATGGGNGTMWVERHPTKAAGNDPGATLNNCQDFPFNLFNGCTYKATESQPGGFAGEGVKLTGTGGAPATLTANATLNAAGCGNATWSATYTVSPSPMFVI